MPKKTATTASPIMIPASHFGPRGRGGWSGWVVESGCMLPIVQRKQTIARSICTSKEAFRADPASYNPRD